MCPADNYCGTHTLQATQKGRINSSQVKKKYNTYSAPCISPLIKNIHSERPNFLWPYNIQFFMSNKANWNSKLQNNFWGKKKQPNNNKKTQPTNKPPGFASSEEAKSHCPWQLQRFTVKLAASGCSNSVTRKLRMTFCYSGAVWERWLHSASGLRVLPECLSRKALKHPQQVF